MNTTQMNTTQSAQMVKIHPRAASGLGRSRDVDAALELARVQHNEWWWLLELHSNVLVAGAVDLDVAAELVETAPTDFLAGYVAGLAVNN